MEIRSQLLNAIEKWQAFKGAPTADPNSQEWKDAHAAYEGALYEAGVYKEALRGQRALSEDVRTSPTEPERTFFHWAYCYAALKPETLNVLQKAKSYSGRTAILDGIHAAFNKTELKKEETRKAACQRRTADLIEEARIDKERAELQKAVAIARAVAQQAARTQAEPEPAPKTAGVSVGCAKPKQRHPQRDAAKAGNKKPPKPLTF